MDWKDIGERAAKGIGISEEEALQIVQMTDPEELRKLVQTAGSIRRTWKADFVNTCGISNAKSGRCAEACSFCSQSAHFNTDAPKYSMKKADTLVAEAKEAFAQGVREFSLVASGRALTNKAEVAIIKDALKGIREETGLQTCASLGLMSREGCEELKEAGLMSVHHNLETARSFHPNIVSTHSYDEEVDTIKAAKSLGMYTCAGGIFGMGESWAQRVELALELRDLDVDSVPLNFLNPRPGTPLQEQATLPAEDCLKIIALFRLVLPTKDLVVCGGRALNLGERQGEIFEAGANGVMIGNYLTTAGRQVDLDLDMLEAAGMVVRAPPHQPHPPSLRPTLRVEGTDRNGL